MGNEIVQETCKKCRSGSMTIEAAIVFPTVLFCIIALIYICMILYQYAYAQSVADQAAENGAAMWNSPYKDMFLQMIDPKGMDKPIPYWRIKDGKLSEKEEKVKKYISYKIDHYSVLGKGTASGTPVELEDKIVYKRLCVTVEQTYKLPIGNLLRPFGINPERKITAKAYAVINEPVEFIRNVDFLLDTGKQIDRSTGGSLTKVRESIVETLKKFSGKLGDFLK